jgi:hypothetical protein
VIGLDVYFREGRELKLAAAGLDRLTLRDAQRESHCDAAAFLAGYSLGLPCFCFRPDVLEALRMVKDSPQAMDAYKQPLARPLLSTSESSVEGKAATSFFQSALNAFPGSSAKKLQTTYVVPSLPKPVGPAPGIDTLSLGRVLVWLMVSKESVDI